MRAFVTGGAGFIGSHLVKTLLKTSSVLNYDKLTYAGRLENLVEIENHTNYQFIHGDILDYNLLTKSLKEFKPTVVFHLAAESHVDRSIDSCEPFIQTNVEGTQKVLQASLQYFNSLTEAEKQNFRFIHVSTDEVFGALGNTGEFNEESPYLPNSPYAASKAASDLLARAFNKTYGLPVIITNCSNNYGPNQFPEKLIPLIILNALENKKLPVYGQGLQVRDWLYVEDHVDALISIANKGNVGQYCIGGGFEIQNINIVKMICEIIDTCFPEKPPHSRLIEFVKDRPGHDFRYAINSAKLEQELGWHPKSNFVNALKETVYWYLNNNVWVDSIKKQNNVKKI